MRVVSASILVLASAVMVTGGSFVQHSDTALFVQVSGGLVGLVGLVGWLVAYAKSDDR